MRPSSAAGGWHGRPMPKSWLIASLSIKPLYCCLLIWNTFSASAEKLHGESYISSFIQPGQVAAQAAVLARFESRGAIRLMPQY